MTSPTPTGGEHAPEPWDAEQGYDGGGNPTPEWGVLAGEDGIVAEPCTKADALRIVACVNACAGLADPEREIARLRERVTFLEGHDHVKQCRALEAEVTRLREENASLKARGQEFSEDVQRLQADVRGLRSGERAAAAEARAEELQRKGESLCQQNGALLMRLAEAEALLREVQYEGNSEPGWKCVVCDYASPGHTEPTGHAPGCRLAAFLKDTGARAAPDTED